ncbi:NAD-dependent epimerase/dehydratase family protein [Streptomyces triticagri]|uniref:NAD-dependent epimerase/dehydratase family protein n=1 Tax=Streptomyces triticagri TaxID=2293568 RepID=A0A372M1P6_9ACTN|nr:NAD(P)H-binding protein [Streptomyces triticagri]RFU84207.1 NAD-dependent epimerase/dehydratase family protein [Streptomyces triticagri]
MTTVLVTGGTGTLGRQVCERLRAGGHEVRALSRHAPDFPVDLLSGAGLDRAVTGAEAIVHCASAQQAGADERAARNLIEAARRAGVGHLVYISIVGVDEVPLGYYRTKRRVEQLVEESGIGWTVLRTTQFHELILQIATAVTRLPLAPFPSEVSSQPIAAAEVADRLAELALAGPAGRVPDMGGPEARTLRSLIGAYAAAAGRRRAFVPVRLPGRTFAAARAGRLLAQDRAVGRTTFEEFLAERMPVR